MRRHKRDPSQRSFNRGYQAAIHDKPLSSNPFNDDNPQAFHWTRGWREGRHDHWDGFNEMTAQQKVVNL